VHAVRVITEADKLWQVVPLKLRVWRSVNVNVYLFIYYLKTGKLFVDYIAPCR